jgi:hypothetical protein
MILLNKLKEMYMTHDVNTNTKLTDHAKVINGQLISQLNQNKLLHIKNRKVEPSLIDIFHDNLIFVRNIGHSELVFNTEFRGGMQKDFSKNWKLDGRTDKSSSYECFICHRYRYVQIFFRRETIMQDFEVVKDERILQIFRKVYGLEELHKKNEEEGKDKVVHPYIFGSVTDWNL